MASNLRKIAIVGEGIIGLTSASRLLKKGYSVDIYSKDNKITSMSAGAYWWPHRIYPEKRVSKWSAETYAEYKKCQSESNSGILFNEHFRFCVDSDESAYVRYLLDEWHEIEGEKYGIPCQEAYRLIVPVIDVPVYMTYLKSLLETEGARFYQNELEHPSILFPDYDLVVNCTGVWAHHFVNDKDVFPIRGQTVRVTLPEGLRESTRLYKKEDKFTLILPRTNDVILGGTAHEGDWNLEPNDADTSIIFEQCSKLVPQIKNTKILGTTVGLRPGRKEVRLELELINPEAPVVHNYGHGGGGFTVAWGCANEVGDIVDKYFSGSG